MEKKLRTCAVCMGKYSFCPRCREDANKELWHFTFCSQNCHDIYGVTSKFEDGHIDASEAKEQVSKLDLSKLDNFGESYKTSISKIMSAKPEHDVEVSATDNIDAPTEDEVQGLKNNSDEEKSIKKSRSRKAKILNSDLQDSDRGYDITI